MMEGYGISLLNNDSDLTALIPLVEELSTRTNTNLRKHLSEVVSPNSITLIAKRNGETVGYICGYFLTDIEFYISQMLSKRINALKVLHTALLNIVGDKGAKTILGHIAEERIAKYFHNNGNDPSQPISFLRRKKALPSYYSWIDGYKIVRYLIAREV